MVGIVRELSSWKGRGMRKVFWTAALAVMMVCLPLAYAEEEYGGNSTIFVMSNDPTGNDVYAIAVDNHGNMTMVTTASTGGNGASGLGNQGGVLAVKRGVVVVNAGSNTITSLRYHNGTLAVADVLPSGGTRPISLTRYEDIICVLNAGNTTVEANVVCFRLRDHGELDAIPGATQILGLGKGTAQVGFCNHGRILAVTAKATNEILTVPVHGHNLGSVMSFDTTVGAGRVPFGFGCADNVLVVSFATSVLSGTPSGAGSFQVAHDGSVVALTPFVSDTRHAACWVALSKDNDLAYVINTATMDISSYEVAHDGQIVLVSEVTATVGVPVTDAAVVRRGQVFVVLSPSGRVTSYAVHTAGLSFADALVLVPGINGVDGW